MNAQLLGDPAHRTLGPRRIGQCLQDQPHGPLPQFIGVRLLSHDSDLFVSSLPPSNPRRFIARPGPPPHPDPAHHDPQQPPLQPTAIDTATHRHLAHHIGAPPPRTQVSGPADRLTTHAPACGFRPARSPHRGRGLDRPPDPAGRTSQPSVVNRPGYRPARAPLRVPLPGSLVHVDVKKIGNIPDCGGWRHVGVRQGARNRASTPGKARGLASRRPVMGYAWVHSEIDDYSRVVYSKIHDDEKADTAAGVL